MSEITTAITQETPGGWPPTHMVPPTCRTFTVCLVISALFFGDVFEENDITFPRVAVAETRRIFDIYSDRITFYIRNTEVVKLYEHRMFFFS